MLKSKSANMLLSFIKSRSKIYIFQRYRNKSSSDCIDWQSVSRLDHYPDDDVICSICLSEPLIPRMDKCGHIFCLSCLINLSKHNDSTFVLCPVCKNYKINVVESKRVTISTNDPIEVGRKLKFRLLVKGTKSIYPDFYYSLCPPLPNAPVSSDKQAVFSNVVVDFDCHVIDRIKADIATVTKRSDYISQMSGDDIVHETLQFLYREQSDFEVYMRVGLEKAPPDSLDGFNFLLDLEPQRRRFSLFYQSEMGRFVFLEPKDHQRMMKRVSTDQNMCLDFATKVATVRTETASEEWLQASGFTHVPVGAAVTIVGLNKKPSFSFRKAPMEAVRTLMNCKAAFLADLEEMEAQRQQSEAKRASLKARGIDFTPMVDQCAIRRDIADFVSEPLASIPASFNLCQIGLECLDPDDDYPHAKTCVYAGRRPPSPDPEVTSLPQINVPNDSPSVSPFREPAATSNIAVVDVTKEEAAFSAMTLDDDDRPPQPMLPFITETPSRNYSPPETVRTPPVQTHCRNYPPDIIKDLPAHMRPAPFTVNVVGPRKKCSQREEKNRRKQRRK